MTTSDQPPAEQPAAEPTAAEQTAAQQTAAEQTAAEQIDALVARHPDWRGAVLADLRRVVLAVDPAIVETWKWMGAPVWELDGILAVGNVFRAKVKLGFMYGASLPDPTGLFNGELGGNQRRSYELSEGDRVDEAALADLVRAAIAHNRARRARSARRR